MKKNLLIAASFFVLGGLLISPLRAMEEERRDVSNPKTPKYIFMSDLGSLNEQQTPKTFFQHAYTYFQNVVDQLKEDATFEDYSPLILSYIGFKGYDEKVNDYIEILENKEGQIPEVRFFISFLKEMDEFRDFSPHLVAQAKSLDINTTAASTQILKIFVLEEFESIEALKQSFCEKYLQDKYDSELNLIRFIYESLMNEDEENLAFVPFR